MIDGDLTASVPGSSINASDSSIGFYIHGGVRVQIGEGAAIGFDYRILRGTDINYNGFETDADYEQLAFTFSSGY